MSDSVAKAESPADQPQKRVLRRTVTPDVDVFENGDEILVVADVPGVSRAAIDVRVERGTLTLETKAPPEGQEEGTALAREYGVYDFARSFRIPEGIDAAAVRAEVKHGTLTVHLPKAAASKPRKIAVSAS